MDSFKILKGITAFIDSKENLKSDIVFNIEMLEQNKGLKKRTSEKEEAIITITLSLQKKIHFLNDKIKGLCTKAELSGFVTEQRSEFIFRTSINNRHTEKRIPFTIQLLKAAVCLRFLFPSYYVQTSVALIPQNLGSKIL